MAEGAGALRPLNDEFGNPGLQARPLSSIAFLLNLHSYFFLVRHRSFRPARDETVPHPSSVFCSMGGRPQRPTIAKSPFCFLLVRHRSFRLTEDETVPHPSSVFCSMGGRPQRPTICKSPFCLLLGRPRNCHTHRLRAPSISRPLRNGWESKLPGTPIPEPAY
jgi:hypothetical protein